jgi:putative two-component system response regulator
MPHDQAVVLILAGRSTQFDPQVVDAFERIKDQIREISGRYHDAGE